MQCHSQCLYVRLRAQTCVQCLVHGYIPGSRSNEMKLTCLSGSSPLPAAIRAHRPGAYAHLTVKSAGVRVFSRGVASARSSAHVLTHQAISVDSLGVGFGVAGARKQVCCLRCCALASMQVAAGVGFAQFSHFQESSRLQTIFPACARYSVELAWKSSKAPFTFFWVPTAAASLPYCGFLEGF